MSCVSGCHKGLSVFTPVQGSPFTPVVEASSMIQGVWFQEQLRRFTEKHFCQLYSRCPKWLQGILCCCGRQLEFSAIYSVMLDLHETFGPVVLGMALHSLVEQTLPMRYQHERQEDRLYACLYKACSLARARLAHIMAVLESCSRARSGLSEDVCCCNTHTSVARTCMALARIHSDSGCLETLVSHLQVEVPCCQCFFNLPTHPRNLEALFKACCILYRLPILGFSQE